jgi:hypothetical protein
MIKLKNMRDVKKIIIGVIALFLIFFLMLAFSAKGTKIYSRLVFEHAEKLVSEDMKISPPEAARFYAYISTLYYEILTREKNPGKAIMASSILIDQIYPNEKYKTTKFLSSLNLDRNLSLSTDTQIFFDNFLKNEKNEREIKTKIIFPKRNNLWSGEHFLGIESLNYKYWILKKSFVNEIATPPQENSKIQKQAIQSLTETTKNVDLENAAWINYWSGMHMTPSLSGIWQDRLWTISKSHRLTDFEYAYTQMILAQSISDIIKETWEIKYKYLTKRPSTYTKEITLSMEDPQYPSYVSEYSSIANVAGNIIINFFPYRKNLIEEDIQKSSNISKWAGCSFIYDEENGAILGKKVLENILENTNIKSLRNNSYLPDFLYTLKARINNLTSEAKVYTWGEN